MSEKLRTVSAVTAALRLARKTWGWSEERYHAELDAAILRLVNSRVEAARAKHEAIRVAFTPPRHIVSVDFAIPEGDPPRILAFTSGRAVGKTAMEECWRWRLIGRACSFCAGDADPEGPDPRDRAAFDPPP